MEPNNETKEFIKRQLRESSSDVENQLKELIAAGKEESTSRIQELEQHQTILQETLAKTVDNQIKGVRRETRERQRLREELELVRGQQQAEGSEARERGSEVTPEATSGTRQLSRFLQTHTRMKYDPVQGLTWRLRYGFFEYGSQVPFSKRLERKFLRKERKSTTLVELQEVQLLRQQRNHQQMMQLVEANPLINPQKIVSTPTAFLSYTLVIAFYLALWGVIPSAANDGKRLLIQGLGNSVQWLKGLRPFLKTPKPPTTDSTSFADEQAFKDNGSPPKNS